MALLLRSLVVLALCCTLVFAVQHSHRHFESFYPPVPRVHLRNVAENGVNFLSQLPSITTEDSHLVALDLAEQVLGFPTTYAVKNSYVTEHNNVRHVYLKQTAADGREIFNADLNINVKDNKALNVGHSFFNGSVVAQQGSIPATEALNILIAFLKIDNSGSFFVVVPPAGNDQAQEIDGVKGSVSAAKIRAGYMQVDNGQRIVPAWEIELDMNDHWWNAQVSMHNGEVLAVYDWVADAQYTVIPIGVNDPSDGSRVIVTDPATVTASPLGWNSQGVNLAFTDTRGNNVLAQSNPSGGTAWQNNPRPNAGASLNFNYPVDFALQPATYVNASTTNLFAWNNYIHDIFYQYGFTEAAGNFQEDNFGKGGKGVDAVQANSQDGAGFNNANFATPVDGSRPRMRMYIWNRSTPNRDGDLDVGIIVHEYAHGISTRLTGGPANSNCLGSGEAGGMGEGWGDWFATVIRQRASYNRNDVFPMGDYSANQPRGIRLFPYSTDLKIDPETYSYINGGNYTGVHAKGEVWCGILWETYWNLVDAYGFSDDLYLGNGGNNRILRNVVDGLKLQPCNPNFVDARDAILLADQANFGGENYCLLWRGFAKRGLGQYATGTKSGVTKVVEDYTVPAQCL